VFESGIGDIAAAIMGSPYSVFYHEHVLNKEPGKIWLSCLNMFLNQRTKSDLADLPFILNQVRSDYSAS
jgi:hypothetical protein